MRITLALFAWLSASACSGFIDKQAASSTYRIVATSQVAAARQSDVELARAAAPSGILQLEAFALAYPEHRGFKLLHAETLCQYAFGFVFDDWEDAELRGRADEAAQLAQRVRRLARSCTDANLALAPAGWRAAREDPAAWSATIATVTRQHLPQLLWITTSDATLLALDPMNGLTKLPSVVTALRRCTALEPGFHDSDAELLLGTLEAGISQFLGGPDGSARFAQARARLGAGAWIVEVMYARGPLAAKKERAQLERTLRQVLAADPAQWPERRLANELARRKAERYLAAIDRLIDGVAPAASAASAAAR